MKFAITAINKFVVLQASYNQAVDELLYTKHRTNRDETNVSRKNGYEPYSDTECVRLGSY